MTEAQNDPDSLRRRSGVASRRRLLALLALVSLSCAGRAGQAVAAPHRDSHGMAAGQWQSQRGTCMEIPAWQVHELDRDLYILRQSPCTSYEKPFVFLIFGNDRALLLDTGAGKDNQLATTLVWLMRQWLERTGRRSMPLVVIHTHEHGDHRAGDAEIAALRIPELPVTIVPLELEATKHIIGITSWPAETGHIDLGERILDVIPIPGHSKLSLALYDRRTSILFTGDTLYPGRLYVSDLPAFEASIARLVRFTDDKPVAHVIGNHVEQTSTPFQDYPIGTIFQPDEHELALSRGSLLELQAALTAMHGTPRRVALRDFTIWPSGPGFDQPDEIERAKQYIEDQERARWSAPR